MCSRGLLLFGLLFLPALAVFFYGDPCLDLLDKICQQPITFFFGFSIISPRELPSGQSICRGFRRHSEELCRGTHHTEYSGAGGIIGDIIAARILQPPSLQRLRG